MLSSLAWAICKTHHSIIDACQSQLVLDQDILLNNIKFVADWEIIRLRKQEDVDRNNDQNSLIPRKLSGR